MKPNRFRFHAPSVFHAPLRYGAPVFTGLIVTIAGLDARGGDILRAGAGGGGAPATTGGSSAGSPGTPVSSQVAHANARDTLARTTRALDAMKAVQAAARAAAAAGPNSLGTPTNPLPTVPNGLGTGGLLATGGNSAPTHWIGANAPTQEIADGKTTVTIKQTAQQALLQWETFNVGKETTLTFDQKAGGENVGQWIAFNQVNDLSANPSQILGNIKADGQIYLINRNGIIFGGSSQVNARGLTVSSLPINTNLIDRGLLNNPDAQFLFSGLNLPAGINGTPAFTPEQPPSATGKYGDVVVEQGAILESPTDAAKVGGRITLVGPNVTNHGSILTPDGQTILAAGLQVGFEAHSSADPALRGLDVFVGAVTNPEGVLYAGTTIQNGVIEAPRGAITIAGREVMQNGALASTTSVSFNGRIDLQANYNAVSNRANANARGALFLFKDSGHVDLGAGSTIGILPEYASKETTIGRELALRSQINLTGKSIHLGEDASIAAPNALVSLAAGSWFYDTTGASPASTLVQTGGQVYLDRGAGIDVAGSIAVPVSVTQNIISVDLRSAELANSPLQRYGSLRNATVNVDIRVSGDGWIGTPLADVRGFANLIQRSVGQLTVAGGSVTISAGDSVVVREGSKIDVSGGSTFFNGGYTQTSRLMSGNKLVDIGSASPSVNYDGIYDGSFTVSNSKFGVTNVFGGVIAPAGTRYEDSYTEGAAGGKISISAPSMALDGGMLGKTVVGEKQRTSLPTSSSLSLAFVSQDIAYPTLPFRSPAPPAITFHPVENPALADPFVLDSNGNPTGLRADRKAQVILSPELLTTAGFGTLSVNNHDGSIVVPDGVNLAAPTGGSISLTASNITISGTVSAAGGNLSFTTPGLTYDEINKLANLTVPESNPPVVPAGRGIFTLSSTGRIMASGLIVDDREVAGGAVLSPLSSVGGSVTILGYSVDLAAGALVDVSGGARIDGKGTITYEKGGSITITAGREPGFNATLGGTLVLDSELMGYSGSKAGSLKITGSALQMGGSVTDPRVTLVNPEVFANQGFGSISLSGVGIPGSSTGSPIPAVRITDGTSWNPKVSGWLGSVGSDDVFSLAPVLREETVRTPAQLTFSGIGASYAGVPIVVGDVILGTGASIMTDAGGNVSFKGQAVTLRGSVIAAGGSITVEGGEAFPAAGVAVNALPTVHIASTATLSTAGREVLVSDPFGRRTGKVFAGGTISVSGNILAESGSLLDVSGNRGTLDLPAAYASLSASSRNSGYVPVTIETNGGAISLRGSKMLFTDAALVGVAGGSSATGGSLVVSSGRFVAEGQSYTTADANLIVRQEGETIASTNTDPGVGKPVIDAVGGAATQQGNFSISSMSTGGFDSLDLRGNVRFEGDVSISVPGTLTISDGGVIYTNGNLALNAGRVALGQNFRSPTQQTNLQLFTAGVEGTPNITSYFFKPTSGSGKLRVTAGLVDIGDLSLDGIGSTWIDASQGDIRGNGTFQMAGDLTLQAGQIHPPTQKQFNVFVYDAGPSQPGTVTILPGAARNLPYSAAGTFAIHASKITQSGTLRAPSGTITLGWDGTGSTPFNPIAGGTAATPVTALLTLASDSVTSVSNIDPITGKALTIPYGISLDGNSWIDPAGNDITVNGPPVKSVNLAATSLVTEQDSLVDIRGGGDLYAYRWVSGNGGTVDILDSSGSFAILPGYNFNYSPHAPFNSDASATNLGGQNGYVNATLKAGDQITLAASGALAAGTYTLLPARYALLPGAVLVTPKSSAPASSSVTTPDGASLVAGYRSNNMNQARAGITSVGGYEIAPPSVVRQRAEYRDLLANKFLRDAAIRNETTVPRLTVDAGYLSFTSSASMALGGAVASLASSGRGGLIDINSASNILINSNGSGSGGLVLDAGILNGFGAESLLIGGSRSFSSGNVSVTANSTNVTLDNAGTPLAGKDIILVSREKLTLAEDSAIVATEDNLVLDTLTLGDSSTSGSGDGTLVRVSANASGRVFRSGLSASTSPKLSILPDSILTGGSIVLDSTSGTSLAESARLNADDIFLNSSQISILLNNPGSINPTNGLVLGGDALASLQNSAKRLSLQSYTTIDTYGTGTVGSQLLESLSLQAAAIRGFNTGGGSVYFSAASLSLGNSLSSSALPALTGPSAGSLSFDAEKITLGANALRIEGFSSSLMSSASGILVDGQGSLSVSGDMNLVTTLLTGTSASKYRILAEGSLKLNQPVSGSPASLTPGFGVDLALEGATVSINGTIALPSGRLSLRAAAGDLEIGNQGPAHLQLSGTATNFVDVIRYTSGGSVSLLSDAGSVRLSEQAAVNVSAPAGGADAGNISVKAPQGIFMLEGSISGSAGANGKTGGFTLDTGSIAGGSLAALDAILNTGSFTLSRDYRIRTSDVFVDGFAKSSSYLVTADSGNIVVSNTIDASGRRGGTIDLKAHRGLTLLAGSKLDASASEFNAAGKGGSVVLEAGNQANGIIDSTAALDLRSGSVIDLSVAANTANSQSRGMFTGTLHLRAPRNAANTDLAVNAIGGSIIGASNILVEGVKLYEVTGAGTITSTLQNSIKSDATAFLGAAGTTTADYTAMMGRLTSLQPGLDPILAPGAEIYNRAGDLVLGTTSSTATSDWNLQTFRFGPKSAAGVLTMRASGDLVFYNALSDGFAAVTPNSSNGNSSLWLAPLMAFNPLLPANAQSWSYRLTSGADFSSADFRSVLPKSALATDKGSFLLGKNYGNAASYGSGTNFTTATAINGRYQVIRTGSGDITINSARNTYILNQFASIYTAGTVVSDPTTVLNPGDFVVPLLLSDTGRHPTQGSLLGAVQQPYYVQYSMAGGDVTIHAGNDIARKTRNTNSTSGGTLIDDSSRQLPSNWLYRRGFIDLSTGASGVAGVDDGGASLTDPDASTTWWVDFSSFFEGVGTLGGGDILISAGNDVKNIDALAPTNARMASGVPSDGKLSELGGGDVRIIAGNHIDGGVYYLERGAGSLEAGGSITTNATRSPSRGILASLTSPIVLDSKTWLPTTLFIGKGGFDIQASGDVLLGPVSNPFWLPQGINNKYWYKTYFNTYAPDSYVNVVSLGGSITHRSSVSLPTEVAPRSTLSAWLTAQQSLSTANGAASFQPWLRTVETNTRVFDGLTEIMAPTLRSTALSGNINLAGNITLAPSPQGQLELLAKGTISGLQASGFNNNLGVQRWITSSINLSDADPASIYGIKSPYAYLQVVGRAASAQRVTGSGAGAGFLDALNSLFAETGSTRGVLQDEQALHTPGNLHANDSQPVRIFATNGNIDGFKLFSPKATRITAGQDIGDISFYLQNLSGSDVSVVSAGRDLVLYNEKTVSRFAATRDTASNPSVSIPALAGDIQISGPGTLQVLSGRNLDLGLGSGNADGTGSGISSIGNGRNPYLGFEGAGLTIGAGITPASSVAGSSLTFEEFISKFATSPDGDRYLAEARGILGVATDYEGTKTLKNGIKIKSVTAGGAGDAAGLQAGDVILKVGDREILSGYDDSYLLSGIQAGVASRVQILRDGVMLELDITPGNNLLDLADPSLTQEQQKQLALSIFYLALRDAGRDFNDPDSAGYRKYDTGFAAIKSLFPESTSWKGEILTQSRDIRTRSGGDISIFAPGGGLTMANATIGNPLTPPGIVTESGGSINVFTDQSVGIGIGRIFTLKGGNVAIWSSEGDIAAGSSSRTVSAAPPTRVIIDPQSASVETDLAGLATGGGIGVLATVEGVAPGNVDLIAPTGIIDAGDAGIRVSGNINLAAVTVVNAGNISAGGSSAGAPVAASAPSVSTVTSASNSSAAAGSTVEKPSEEQKTAETQVDNDETPSLYTVEVIGYGGGPSAAEDEEEKDKEKESEKPTEGADVQ